MSKKSNKISNFEEDLKKLQAILDDIESDKLTLEDSILKYTPLYQRLSFQGLLNLDLECPRVFQPYQV